MVFSFVYTYKKYVRGTISTVLIILLHPRRCFILFYFICVRTRTKMRTIYIIALSCTLSKHCSIIFISTWYMKKEFSKAFNFFSDCSSRQLLLNWIQICFIFIIKWRYFLLSFVVFSGFSVCMLVNVGMRTGEENKRIKKQRERESVHRMCSCMSQIQTIHVN